MQYKQDSYDFGVNHVVMAFLPILAFIYGDVIKSQKLEYIFTGVRYCFEILHAEGANHILCNEIKVYPKWCKNMMTSSYFQKLMTSSITKIGISPYRYALLLWNFACWRLRPWKEIIFFKKKEIHSTIVERYILLNILSLFNGKFRYWCYL